MNGLYPIIRRVRRPLIVADAVVAPAVASVAPVIPVAPSPSVEPVQPVKLPEASDAKVSS